MGYCNKKERIQSKSVKAKKLKLIHLSDLHLGKSLNEFSLIEDQKYILNRIIEIIERKQIDAVLIAGDIYDRSVPSEEAVKLFDLFLTKLAEMKKTVFVISGNHDSDERLNFGSQLFTAKNIYINGRYDGKISCFDLEDKFGKVHFWLMPYVKASRVAHFYPEEDTSSYDNAFRVAIDQCNIDETERNVMLTHQFVTGISDPELSGSEKAILNVGNIDKISSECFDAFDYIAMGHIHSSQSVGRDCCRYSGSPLKYSLTEKEIMSEKTAPIITLEEKGNVRIELVPLKPLYDIRHIRGKLKELLSHAVDTEDYIYATLTDEEIQHDAMARLQEVYPRAVKLDYDNESTRKLQQDTAEIEIEGKSFEELISDFSMLINGTEPSEKDWEYLRIVAEEAGVTK